MASVTSEKIWDSYLEDLRGAKAVPENDMVEKVARAICRSIVELNPLRGDWESRIEDEWKMYADSARAAIQAMGDYSEAMSQAGGCVSKMQYGDPMPVGQSIAERCYLAMIDTALQQHQGEFPCKEQTILK